MRVCPICREPGLILAQRKPVRPGCAVPGRVCQHGQLCPARGGVLQPGCAADNGNRAALVQLHELHPGRPAEVRDPLLIRGVKDRCAACMAACPATAGHSPPHCRVSPALLHGMACWFDITFDGSEASVKLDTAPAAPGTHWYQARLLFKEPLAVNRTQCVSGSLTFVANKHYSYYITMSGTCAGFSWVLRSASRDGLTLWWFCSET